MDNFQDLQDFEYWEVDYNVDDTDNSTDNAGSSVSGDESGESDDYSFDSSTESVNLEECEVNDEFQMIVDDYGSSLSSTLNFTFYPGPYVVDENEFSSVSTLANLCCREITRDVNFLQKLFTYLPVHLYDCLMKTAICHEFRESIAILLSKWPSKSITKTVVDSGDLTRYGTDDENFFSKIARRFTLLWTHFLEAVKNDSMSVLRVLDLRGIPMSDAMVYFLLRRIINQSNGSSQSNNYDIIVDCAVHRTCTMMKMISFLNMATLSEEINVHVHVNMIDVIELEEVQCWTLLQPIDSDELVGLRVSSLFSPDFYVFVFTKFSSLRILDIPVSASPRNEMLPFQLLPNLQRLGLVIGSKNILSILPVCTLRKLEYLKISGLIPRSDKIENNFRELISNQLVLTELNLSQRLLIEDHLNLWRKLFRSLAPTLKALYLERCVQNDSLYPALMSFISPLANLRYLSLYENKVSVKTFAEHFPKLLSSLKKLTRLRVGCVSKTDESYLNEMLEKYLCKQIRKLEESLLSIQLECTSQAVW